MSGFSVVFVLALFVSVRSEWSYEAIYEEDEFQAHSILEIPRELQDYTFSAFVKTERSSGRHTVFSYVSRTTNTDVKPIFSSLTIDLDKKQIIYKRGSKEWIVTAEIESDKWVHLAKVFRPKLGENEIFVNGKSVGKDNTLYTKGENIPSGRFYIGQLGAGNGQFDKNSRLVGRMSEINIYRSALDDEEIGKLSKLEEIDVKEDYSWKKDFVQEGRVHISNSSDLKPVNENELTDYDFVFDNKFSNAKATLPLPELEYRDNYAVAIWLHPSKTEHSQTFYAVKTRESKIRDIYAAIIRDGQLIITSNNKEFLISKKVIEYDKWTHVVVNCYYSKKQVDVYINGMKVQTTNDIEYLEGKKSKWLAILGQNDNDDGVKKYEGRMSQFYGYHTVLRDEEVKALYDGKTTPEGAMFNWAKYQFILEGSIAITSTTFEKSKHNSNENNEEKGNRENYCNKKTNSK